MRTPQEFTLTIAAGAFKDINAYGRMITFVDVTVGATLNWAIDNDPKQTAHEGLAYELDPDESFGRIRLFNDGAASLTVKVILSSGRVFDNRSEISEALASIDERLGGEATGTGKTKTNVAATGGTGTTIFSANADRKIVSVTAAEDNTGYIYVGFTDAVSATNAVKVLLPGGEWYDEHYQGAVYAVGSDGSQNVFGYEV